MDVPADADASRPGPVVQAGHDLDDLPSPAGGRVV